MPFSFTSTTYSQTLNGTRIAAVSAAILSLALIGCKKSPDAKGSTATHAQEHDHAHGGESEHADEVTLTAEAVERYGVKMEPAQLWVLNPTFVTSGRVSFNTEAMAHVGSPLRGRATEIMARAGDVVQKDQPLVVVESPELGEAQADFIQSRITAQSTAPASELARVAWTRAKELHEQTQGISLTEVQRREAEYRAAVAAQASAEAIAAGSGHRLHFLGMTTEDIETLAASGGINPRFTIKAAIRGTVVQREITLGELVSPERESLMVLADTGTLWVLADVPETQVIGTRIGAKAWITAAATGEQRFEGEVSYISPMVDPNTRTAQVRIIVPAAALPLKAGMFARVEIVSSDPSGAEPAPIVAVPDAAVQTVEGGPAVFVPVADEPNTFAKRAVTVGKAVGGLIPIYSGLVEGESFISSGSFILKAELGKGSAAHEH